MANAPLKRAGWRNVPQFPIFGKKYFQARTGNPNQLESAHEIGFLAQAIWRRRGPGERGDSVRIDQTDLPGRGQISLQDLWGEELKASICSIDPSRP
jgi:hypothetical protein